MGRYVIILCLFEHYDINLSLHDANRISMVLSIMAAQMIRSAIATVRYGFKF
jgi:hypothetical protein